VLYHLNQESLARLLLPLGEYEKATVRCLAAARGLVVADKPDSQEICFIPDNDYRHFLEQMRPGSARPGPIANTRGEVIGQHTGLPNYTVGQRKGLGLGSLVGVVLLGQRVGHADGQSGQADRQEDTQCRVAHAEPSLCGRPLCRAFSLCPARFTVPSGAG